MASMSLAILVGCLNVNVPEEVVVHHQADARVDSSRVPQTRNLEQCRTELNKAYRYIQTLERKNKSLEKDKAELKLENKQLKKRLERYED